MVYEHTYWEYKHVVHINVVQFIYYALLNVTLFVLQIINKTGDTTKRSIR